jgi:4-oxalomesaconate hydratase
MTLLAIGANSNAARLRPGAPRTALSGGGREWTARTASVIRRSSYGRAAAKSGELWERGWASNACENVKRIRHGEAEAAATAHGADFRCLDLGDYPLEVQGRGARHAGSHVIREIAPDTIVTHTDPTRSNPDHPVAFPAACRAPGPLAPAPGEHARSRRSRRP